MTNLTDKFDELESQLTTQHTALIAALDGLGAKLDAITTALGGAPPTSTVSLADVVAAIQGTNDILGDVHLDTISMDQKLLRIRDAINPLDETLPTEAKTSLPWLLFRLVDAIQPTWPRPTSTPAQPALSLLLALSQLQLPNLADIQGALGTPTGDATTTALGLLSSIQYSNVGIYTSTGVSTGPSDTILSLLAQEVDCACGQGGNGSAGGTCTTPFRSSGMQLIPFAPVGGTNVIVAVWAAPLPAGVSFGSFFGLTDQYAELYNEDWSGWQVLVQSDEQQYADTPTSTARYPTGVWRPMPSGPGNYSWAVSDRGAITVSLCPPGNFDQSGTPAQCVQITVPGNNQEVIVADIAISRPVTVKYISGGTPVAIHPNLTTGQSRALYDNIGVLSSPGQITEPISGYSVLGFAVGSTSQTVVVEVCPATVLE